MCVNKGWLLVCLIWGALGATLLYLSDPSPAGPAVWLVVAAVIGCLGVPVFERFVEGIPTRGDRLSPDPVLILPAAGLIYETLLGPLAGVAIASVSEAEAWQGALVGGILGPPLVALVLLATTPLAPLPEAVPAEASGVKGPGLSTRQRVLIGLMCLGLPMACLVVLVRYVSSVPRQWERLRVYAMLQALGGVFGADPDRDEFYGVRLAGKAIGDGDVGQLRAFPELDHLTLSGTAVTDAGLSVLPTLRKLKIVGLADTAITDAGLAHLRALTELEVLDLSGTRVGDAGVAQLQGLRELRYLDLRGTLVTEEGVQQLSRALPHLGVRRTR